MIGFNTKGHIHQTPRELVAKHFFFRFCFFFSSLDCFYCWLRCRGYVTLESKVVDFRWPIRTKKECILKFIIVSVGHMLRHGASQLAHYIIYVEENINMVTDCSREISSET